MFGCAQCVAGAAIGLLFFTRTYPATIRPCSPHVVVSTRRRRKERQGEAGQGRATAPGDGVRISPSPAREGAVGEPRNRPCHEYALQQSRVRR